MIILSKDKENVCLKTSNRSKDRAGVFQEGGDRLSALTSVLIALDLNASFRG